MIKRDKKLMIRLKSARGVSYVLGAKRATLNTFAVMECVSAGMCFYHWLTNDVLFYVYIKQPEMVSCRE